MEIDPIYVEVALRRWERFAGSTAERLDAERMSAVQQLPPGSQREQQAAGEEHSADGGPQPDVAQLDARRIGRAGPVLHAR